MAKTLYHSELAGLEWVEVTIKSEVTPSKYSGKPPFVTMVVDRVERNYNVENDACADALRGRIGQKVVLRAFGSREEATIELEQGTPEPQRNAPAQQPRSQQPKGNTNTRQQPSNAPTQPQSGGKSPLMLAKEDRNRICNLELLALEGAVGVMYDFNARHDFEMSFEQLQAVAAHVFMNLKDRGHLDAMPVERLNLPEQRTPRAKQ